MHHVCPAQRTAREEPLRGAGHGGVRRKEHHRLVGGDGCGTHRSHDGEGVTGVGQNDLVSERDADARQRRGGDQRFAIGGGAASVQEIEASFEARIPHFTVPRSERCDARFGLRLYLSFDRPDRLRACSQRSCGIGEGLPLRCGHLSVGRRRIAIPHRISRSLPESGIGNAERLHPGFHPAEFRLQLFFRRGYRAPHHDGGRRHPGDGEGDQGCDHHARRDRAPHLAPGEPSGDPPACSRAH